MTKQEEPELQKIALTMFLIFMLLITLGILIYDTFMDKSKTYRELNYQYCHDSLSNYHCNNSKEMGRIKEFIKENINKNENGMNIDLKPLSLLKIEIDKDKLKLPVEYQVSKQEQRDIKEKMESIARQVFKAAYSNISNYDLEKLVSDFNSETKVVVFYDALDKVKQTNQALYQQLNNEYHLQQDKYVKKVEENNKLLDQNDSMNNAYYDKFERYGHNEHFIIVDKQNESFKFFKNNNNESFVFYIPDEIYNDCGSNKAIEENSCEWLVQMLQKATYIKNIQYRTNRTNSESNDIGVKQLIIKQ